MRNLVVRWLGMTLVGLAPLGVHADDAPSDFILSLMRFGIECKQAAAPRKAYIGDATRFGVSVEQKQPAAAEGDKPVTARVTYRAFYRDLQDPNVAQDSVTLRCKGQAKCIAFYKGGSIEKVSSVQLDTCSSRTATLVSGAAREFIKSAAR